MIVRKGRNRANCILTHWRNLREKSTSYKRSNLAIAVVIRTLWRAQQNIAVKPKTSLLRFDCFFIWLTLATTLEMVIHPILCQYVFCQYPAMLCHSSVPYNCEPSNKEKIFKLTQLTNHCPTPFQRSLHANQRLSI